MSQAFHRSSAPHANPLVDAAQVLLLAIDGTPRDARDALLSALEAHGIDEQSLRGADAGTPGWAVDADDKAVYLDLWIVDRYGWTGREPIKGYPLSAEETLAVAWWLLCSWQPDAMQSKPHQHDIEHAVRWVDGGGRVPREWFAQAERVQAIEECFAEVVA